MKNKFVVYFSLAILALVAAGVLLWLYWLAASWLVDTVLGVHNLEGFILKILIFFLLQGIIKGLDILRKLGPRPN